MPPVLLPLSNGEPAAASLAGPLVDDARSTVFGIGFAVLASLLWSPGDTAAKWALPVAGVGGDAVARRVRWDGAGGSRIHAAERLAASRTDPLVPGDLA